MTTRKVDHIVRKALATIENSSIDDKDDEIEKMNQEQKQQQ